MQKINFQNLPSTTTPVNADNLNDLQDNIEDVFDGTVAMGSIKTTGVKINNESVNLAGDYATLTQNSTQTINITAWSTMVLPLSSNATFNTSNSNLFSHNNNGIKCNFNGVILVYSSLCLGGVAELDVIISGKWFTSLGVKQNSAMFIFNVNQNDVINLEFSSGLNGSQDVYVGTLEIVRLA